MKKPSLTIEDAKRQIVKAIRQNGTFSHNICSLVLRSVADVHGRKAANDLIDEFDLTDLYDIEKVAV